ncbi:MAG: hypothetical protein KatS3mg115_2519 [Candidatus Poribacteria bacterium]|nr:MAG: hypothetical protein KatS3mg115_2519 [Candidatus Poribacteria bacterium]
MKRASLQTNAKRPAPSGIRWRVLGLGVPLILLTVAIVSYAELVITYIQIGFLQFPPVVIGILFFLVLANQATRRFLPRLSLSRQELMLLYVMLLLTSMVTSRGLMEKLIPALVAVNYYATETNGWRELFFHHIRPELVPFDPNGPAVQEVARKFYERAEELSTVPWRAWVQPLAVWGILAGLFFFGFLCLAAILRRQWVDNEKLTFPLTQLPLEFVGPEAGTTFFGNPMMWIGFGVPALVFGLNGLHQYVPAVPQVRLNYSVNAWFTERPWNGIFYTPIFISFAAIGFFYLLPTQVLFSLWFFFVLTRLQDVVATALGFRLTTMPLYPTREYLAYQVAGAYFVLIAWFGYAGLRHFRRVFQAAFRSIPPQEREDAEELLPYRLAVWGLLASLVGSVLWCLWAGMSLWVAVFEIGVYLLVVVIVMARSVAEAGMPMTETSFRPVDLYRMFGQKAALGPRNLTLLSFFDAIFTRDLRGLTLTGYLDGLKIADGVGFRRRTLLVAVPLTLTLAFLSAAVVQLYLPYAHGANFLYGYVYRANPIWAFQDYAPAVEGVRPPVTWVPLFFFLVGAVVTGGLALLRSLYWWWPLHPLGYALSASWTLIVFWFSILVAWSVKTPLLQYSGVRGVPALSAPVFRDDLWRICNGRLLDGGELVDPSSGALFPLALGLA